MKRFLLFALAVIVFAACSKDAINEQQNMQTIVDEAPETITVGFEGEETRIQLNEAQKTVWTKGDLVSVFYKSDANQKYEYRGETGERTAELHKVGAGSSTTKMGYVVVAYPYNEEYIISPATGNLETMLPAVQHYAVDSYGVGDNLMVSCSEFTQFSLKSVCGWLKLQLTGNGEKVKSITLRGNNGEQVAGLIHVDTKSAEATLYSEEVAPDDNGDANGSLVIDGAMVTELTLDCGEGVTLGKEATAFYIALPPQTFEQGLTVDVNCKGYNPMSITTQKVVAIERNHIQPMAEVAFSSDVRTIANNEIWYIAPQKIDRSNYTWTYDTFGANVVSNEWDSLSGEGIITFDGEVTKIGDKAFQSANITSITLSDSVILIGAHAFEWCQSLSSIQIPANVERIGMLAFYNSAISEITFKTSKLTTIEDGAFLNCAELIEINLPTSITHIGGTVFRGCTKLEGINMGYTNAYWSAGLPDCQALFFHDHEKYITTIVAYPAGAVTQNVSCYVHPFVNIAWGAFWDCDHIVEVWLSFIRSIEQMNFCYCDNLEYIDLNQTAHIANNVLSYCDKLEAIDAPDAAFIGEDTFCNNKSMAYIKLGSDKLTTISRVGNNNENLNTVHIPSGVESIANSFNGNAMLAEVYCMATTPPALTDSFDSIPENATLYVPVESVGAYKSAEGWKEFAIVGYDFENGEIVEVQPNNQIWYTSSDGDVVTPDNTYAFGANIKSNTYTDGKGVITFDGDVTTIGNNAFYCCNSLTSVTIPDSVTTIGNYAFYGCNITSVTIPDSVKTIGEQAFEYCRSLTSVYCKATTPPALVGTYVFYGNGSGRKIYVPAGFVNAYKSATNWSEYKSAIVGFDFENGVVVE